MKFTVLQIIFNYLLSIIQQQFDAFQSFLIIRFDKTFMMKFAKLLCFFALCIISANAKSYKGHKLITFRIENENQLKEVQSLQGEPGVR